METANEKIDYVARAKALMKGAARTGALIIVPIAAAVSAHADIVLPTSSLSCSMRPSVSSVGSCTAGDAQTPALYGVDGVDMFTTGSGGAFGEVGYSGSSSNTASITFNLNGQMNLTAGDPDLSNGFLLSYLIDAESVANSGGVGTAGGFGTVSFDPTYTLTATLNGNPFYSITAAAADHLAGATISGSAVIGIPADIQAEIADLEASGSGDHTFDLAVTASIGWTSPSSCCSSISSQIQLNTESLSLTTTTPEPGTTGTMLGGLLGMAGFFGFRRRNRRNA